MSEFDKKRLLELLNSIKTEVIYCNPSDRAILDEAMEETKTTHIFEVRETEAIKRGELVRINKKDLEKYLHPDPPINQDHMETVRNCNNCKYQPGPLLMCAWMKEKSEVYLKCPKWEARTK